MLRRNIHCTLYNSKMRDDDDNYQLQIILDTWIFFSLTVFSFVFFFFSSLDFSCKFPYSNSKILTVIKVWIWNIAIRLPLVCSAWTNYHQRHFSAFERRLSSANIFFAILPDHLKRNTMRRVAALICGFFSIIHKWDRKFLQYVILFTVI